MKLSHNLVVLDLETTGTWVEKDKIVEIGLIKCYPDGKKEVYRKRVNPGIMIPKNVSKLIGITNEDIKDAPAFKSVAMEVFSFIDDSDLGGFNIERFDLPLLQREFGEAGMRFEWQDRVIYDAQKIFHVNEKRDLSSAYQFYCNKIIANAHSAIDDAGAALEILDAQLKKYGKGNDSAELLQEFEYERVDEYFDKERKFRWWNGELYPTFGKYARKHSVRKIAQFDRSFLEWILTRDFSDEVKMMIGDVLNGRMPKYPH